MPVDLPRLCSVRIILPLRKTYAMRVAGFDAIQQDAPQCGWDFRGGWQ
jgi:hypothetical protein